MCRTRKGYSLIEILIVIGIVGVLLAVLFLISMYRAKTLKDRIAEAEELKNQNQTKNTDLITLPEELKRYRAELDRKALEGLKPTYQDPALHRMSQGVHYDSNDAKQSDKLARRLLEQAMLLARGQNPKDALILLKQASELNPVDPDIYCELAKVALVSGDHKMAMEGISAALKLDDTYADAYLIRARLALKEGGLEQAKLDLEKAAGLKQKNAEIFLIWSEFYLKQGQPEKAEEAMSNYRAVKGN